MSGQHFSRLNARVMKGIANGQALRSNDETKVVLAGEIGHAALGHGLDALLEIGGFAQPVLLGELVFGRLGDAVGKAGPQGRPG
jgi:hypothetical protein